MANTMSKSELIQRIVEGYPNEIARKDVKGVIEAVAEIGHKELKKTGAFLMPGLAKFIVIKKLATKARQAVGEGVGDAEVHVRRRQVGEPPWIGDIHLQDCRDLIGNSLR